MFTALLLPVALVTSPRQATSGQQAPQTETYTDSQLGLSITHPTTWILELANAPSKQKGHSKHAPKRSKDDSVHFRIPLPGALDDADLIIMRSAFSGTVETWQAVQADANKDLHRTVERQWQEEILGVPLLLTKINYTQNGNPVSTLTGLLYNDSASKLLFRLTGPASDFDKAQFEFDQAMQTLRTTNNELPKPEDPNAPARKPGKVDDRGLKHVLLSPKPTVVVKLAPVTVPVVVSTKNVELRLPKGWSGDHVDGSSLELHCPGISYPVQIKLYYTLDSDPVGTAFVAASGTSLKQFTRVDRREDAPQRANEGGCTVTSVWRTGRDSSGPIVSMEAAGVSGDFYFVATCRPVAGPTLVAQRRSLDELLQQISIRAVP